ncbi:MAG: hypothetical protein GWN58_68115, partial [Anaerolineae bacterium]|nr:hypothetical protein [Anaerolineae bacterium]
MKSNGKIWYVLLLSLMIVSLVVASCGSTEPTQAPEAKPTEEVQEPAEDQVTIAFSGFSSTNEFWLTLARAAEARAD